METAEQLPAAETHLTITQSSYVTQAQSKHLQHTHTHAGREPQRPTLLPRLKWERRQGETEHAESEKQENKLIRHIDKEKSLIKEGGKGRIGFE